MRVFEAFLREQAAEFIKEEVRRANDPLPPEEPPVTTPERIREAPISVVIRRLLRHADEDFSRWSFDVMAARARRDTRRYWEFACCFWSRTLGVDMAEIDLPDNTWELEEKFWRQVDAAIGEAVKGRRSRSSKKRR
jgi:hypothetical protein